jgi:molecular chaperone GrpE
MPEPAPPPDACGTLGGGDGPLTPAAIDALLAEFRSWLEQMTDAPDPEPASDAPRIDLATLAGMFTALRHDVNLQTKAARMQAEQSAQALALLHDTIDRLGAPARVKDGDALLMTLVEAADVLSRAERGLQQALDLAQPKPPSIWRRWFAAESTSTAARSALAATLEGVRLGYQRLERALQQHGLERIPAVGFPFDPELMEAIEAVAGVRQPPGTVLEEVRIGYHRNGVVFRCAQVKVAQ